MELNKIIQGDAYSVLKTLPDKCIQSTITSPPYWGLRAYGTDPISWPAVEYSIFGFKINIPEMSCELGHEKDPNAFIGHMVLIFREIHRVMRDDGTLWLNIGDSYAGSGKGEFQKAKFSKKQASNPGANDTGKRKFSSSIYKSKDLIGIPWMLAYALRDDGWYLRQDIIWNKPNPMPESVTDRCTKAHEYLFLLTKSTKYYYDQDAIRTEITDNTVKRMSQQIENQKGSERAFGGHKHNGPMKAVGPGRTPRKEVDTRGGNQGSSTGIKAYSHRLDGGGDKKMTGHSGNFDAEGNLIGSGMANKKSVWTVVTMPFSEAHFATFPQELIVDCIKAGSSEHGCCSKCGAPWHRVTEKELVPTAKASYNSKTDQRDLDADPQDQGSNRMKDGHKPGWVNKVTTTGWAPTCKCENSEIIPCIILDPFMGAGTTAVVARKLMRNYLGIELNQKYIDLSNKRLAKELGMFL